MKKYCEISKHEIAVCEETAGLRSGNFSDLNSACHEVLLPVKIWQFQDMLNESVRFRDEANGLKTHTIVFKDLKVFVIIHHLHTSDIIICHYINTHK